MFGTEVDALLSGFDTTDHGAGNRLSNWEDTHLVELHWFGYKTKHDNGSIDIEEINVWLHVVMG